MRVAREDLQRHFFGRLLTRLKVNLGLPSLLTNLISSGAPRYTASTLRCAKKQKSMLQSAPYKTLTEDATELRKLNTVYRLILTEVCIAKLSLWMWYCTLTSFVNGYSAQQERDIIRQHCGHCIRRPL